MRLIYERWLTGLSDVEPTSAINQICSTVTAHYLEWTRAVINGLDFPTETEFRHFLSLNEPSQILARDWGWFGCPIWHFLNGYGLNPTVYRDGTWSPDREDEYLGLLKMPPWASEFVWLCDLIHPRVMTYGDCLNLLENPLFRPEYWLGGKVRHPIRTIED